MAQLMARAEGAGPMAGTAGAGEGGGRPLAKAVVHGHALVPGFTEWLVARRSRPPSP